MTRLHPDDIQAIAERVVSLLAAPPVSQPLDDVSRVLNRSRELARAGFREESIKLVKSLSQRGRAHA